MSSLGAPSSGFARKRPRSSPPIQVDGAEAKNLGSLPKRAIRDLKYYLEGGDFAIRVEDILFKVHRCFLSRDNSAFADMFAIHVASHGDQISSQACDSSDDSPLTLHGDTAEQFRALLWVLYALPNDIAAKHQCKTLEDFELFLNIAEITNKYNFAHIESWAVSTIMTFISSSSLVASLFKVHGLALASRFIGFTFVSQNQKLRDTFLKEWIPKVLSGSVPLTRAMNIAEKYHLRSLQGAAHYAYVLRLERLGTNGRLPLGNLLNQAQHIRLLHIHWWLSQRWTWLMDNPPTFPHSSLCMQDPRICVVEWKKLWSYVSCHPEVDKISHIDVIARLDCVLLLLKSLVPRIPAACYENALRAVADGKQKHYTDFLLNI